MSPLFSCTNAYTNGRKVSKAYFNGTNLCQDAFSTPGLIPPGAVGTAIIEIDTRLYRRESTFGTGSVDPTNREFSIAIQNYSTPDIGAGKPAIVIDWGDNTVFTGTSRGVDTRGTTIGTSGGNIFDHTYPSPGEYTVTFSNLSINGCSFSSSSGGFGFQSFAAQYQECIKTVRFENDTWRFRRTTSNRSLFRDCINLTSFTAPTIDPIDGGSPFLRVSSLDGGAFTNCSSLTSFPFINTSNITQYIGTWSGCSSLSNFPNNLDFTNSTVLRSTFKGLPITSWNCNGRITAFDLRGCWENCTNLVDFPANKFDGPLRTVTFFTREPDGTFTFGSRIQEYNTNAFERTFKNCALSPQSIENILTSLVTGGATNITLSLEGGTNAVASTWTGSAIAAYNTLISRGWTITRNA